MRRSYPGTVLGNAFRTQLTVPEGKKYEVLAWWFTALNVNATRLLISAQLAVPADFWYTSDETLAGGFALRTMAFPGPVVLMPGDSLQSYALPAALSYRIVVTYMDVDLL